MDPITLLIAALVAGATKVGGEAAMDAYHALMTRLRNRFAKDELAQKVIDEHAKEAAAESASADKPGVWEAPLRMYLTNAGAGDDPDLITAARKVLEAAHQGLGPHAEIKVTAGNVSMGPNSFLSAGRNVASAEVSYSEQGHG